MAARSGGVVTLSDVARHAGVSLATASRAINGSETRVVGEALRDRVRQSAELLGYAPDANAQAVARGSTNTIGVAVNDLTDPYFAAIADAMVVEGDRHGLFLTLATTANRLDQVHEVIASLDSLRVRAMVLVGGRWNETESTATVQAAIDRYRRRGGRVVAVGVEVPGVDCVLIDNAGGSRRIAEFLVERGYRAPLLISGPERHTTSAARARAFLARMRKLGVQVPATHHVTADFTREGGATAMRLALENELSFDVVVATNDVMALGAMSVARRAGLDVPGDVGFVGFGDVGWVADLVPALTSVHVPTEAMGEEAMRLALEGPGDSTGTVKLPVTLMMRDSTPARPRP